MIVIVCEFRYIIVEFHLYETTLIFLDLTHVSPAFFTRKSEIARVTHQSTNPLTCCSFIKDDIKQNCSCT